MKPFYIFNTLGRRVEEFEPLNPPVVTYYSCGPTVYLPQHLGNMRAYVFVDTLRRALELNGYEVRHVMNITDVGHMTSDADAGEDKIEKTARAEGKTPREVADFYIAQFTRDCGKLNIRLPAPPLLCRATDHVADMIALIERIVERGYGYVTRSGVYFDVEKWRGPGGMGRLSRQSLDEQDAGQRLEHSPDKKSPHDFALWVLNQPHHLMQWESPWGRGYPGWHIECSAMSMRYLGETIDIHTGGLDHIPVHHENEIAQSEGATGKPFVRYFVHNAFLVGMEGAKISKSAGRFPVLDDLVADGINPLAFRLLCLGAKYRSELAFSLDAVRAAERNLDYFAEFARNLSDEEADAATDSPWVAEFDDRFRRGAQRRSQHSAGSGRRARAGRRGLSSRRQASLECTEKIRRRAWARPRSDAQGDRGRIPAGNSRVAARPRRCAGGERLQARRRATQGVGGQGLRGEGSSGRVHYNVTQRRRLNMRAVLS